MREFLADPTVVAALASSGSTRTANDRVQMADGAPGALFGDEARVKAMAAARKLLEAAAAPNASTRYAAAMAVGASGARGGFSDMLDSLIVVLGERMRAALHDGNEARASAISHAADSVGKARLLATGNVNPQLLTADLLRDLATAFR